ncbi:hypothetical protein [Vitiosangium sp. GDMCC 1.1324]|uniref:hypothetical protein n=1 Tax=Vitiosangium sp. (strain GDMCC 1.1324) TaxID=2138576 RepID=UPI000D3D1A71|nr:hypothetical protein [Vitiosangium sp. GDMCC 1.1324]PTL80205.1 hypothetical protein DAT35_29850 [Vitiosangium sp. GDMCC 1.1324]
MTRLAFLNTRGWPKRLTRVFGEASEHLNPVERELWELSWIGERAGDVGTVGVHELLVTCTPWDDCKLAIQRVVQAAVKHPAWSPP